MATATLVYKEAVNEEGDRNCVFQNLMLSLKSLNLQVRNVQFYI